ncbi:MATE family efflux transporter [Cellvibrio fibrivorans]|uniref:Multidrug-efflux transporter n=1 Tax=Cellvibrio fibrivorans TaxID=126350 RepID=A0ABU1V3A7_9GAMM|nr:MATE family efflux transporter [Cellvibrio fibrivorans]MDR7091880.1 MATE family multidrug resistance protein [Cellvibrio fibrivorans]
MEPLNTDQLQTLPDHNQSLVARTLHEWKQLAVLGAPILIAQLAQMANGVIDTVMAGHASAEDLAGVAIGASLWVPVLLFFAGVLSALQPTISGHRGAGELQKIMPTTWQGVYIALVAMVVMVLLLVNTQPVLRILQLDVVTAAIADGYLDAFAWGVPALLLLTALRGLTDGLGHTRVIMVFSLISTLLNLPLNYIFIYGFDFIVFQVPAMGGIGCGWATSIANWVATLALLVYLNRSATFKNFHLIGDWVAPAKSEIARLLKLGLPIGFTMFIEVSMFCMIALFLAPLGSTTVAGHQIVLNVTSVLFMLPLSLGMALTLRISFLVGAADHDEARLLARSSLLLAVGISCINAPILFFGREWLAGLYTSDMSVQQVATTLFMLAALFQIVDVIQVTMINVQRGYKDTKTPMFIMLLSFWGICLPLGYVLTFKDWLTAPLGAPGFWMALIAGLTCAALLLTVRMFRFRPANFSTRE